MKIHKRTSESLLDPVVVACGSATGKFSRYWRRVTCEECLKANK